MVPNNKDAHEIRGDDAKQDGIREAMHEATTNLALDDAMLLRILQDSVNCPIDLSP